MTERHDVILAILGTSVVLCLLLLILARFAHLRVERLRTGRRTISIQETALSAALKRQAELIRERDELREKLEDAETRCAILSAVCNERTLHT